MKTPPRVTQPQREKSPRVFACLAAALLGAIALTIAPRSERAPRPVAPVTLEKKELPAPPREFAAAASVATPASDSPAPPAWLQRFAAILDQSAALQSELIEELAGSFTDEEVVTTLRAIGPGQPGTPFATLAECLASRWAARDPADAARWAAQLPPGDFASLLLRPILTAWAERDLTAAIAWLSPLPDNETKAAACLLLAHEAAQRQAPRAALDLATDLAPSPERAAVLTYAAQQWATTDREAALAWTRALPDPALREQIYAKIAVDWSVNDPARAADFAASSLPRGETRDRTLATITQSLASSAPAQAAALLERIADASLRDGAIERLTEAWAKADLAAAGAWLARLPASFSRDTAIGIYAAVLASTGPEQALRWAEAIQEPDFRARVLRQLRSPQD